MAEQIRILQRKVDEAYTDLANLESEKANIEKAKQHGMARRGFAAKLSKLQGLIRGAKLNFSNAEKRLNMALASHQQSMPDASATHEPQQSDLISGGTDDPANFSNTIAGGAGTPVSEPPDAVPSCDAVGEVGGSAVPPTLGIFPSPEVTIPPVHDAAAPAVNPMDNVLPSSPAVPALQSPTSLDVLEPDHNTLKRTDRSESEDEALVVKDTSMNLLTLEDKSKYVELSGNSDSGEGSDIFCEDDEASPMAETVAPANLGKSSPIAAQTKSRLPATKSQQSGAGTTTASTQGKARGDGAREKRKGASTKGLDVKMDVEDGNETEESETVKEARNKGREDYHPSDHSVAKAARANEILAKQRKRWAGEEVTHRQFAEAWLNAESMDDRPPVPRGIELIRKDPDYLPDVATMDYDLALELLLNHSNNYLCIPHVKLNRKIITEIDNLEGPVRIFGAPMPRNQNPNVSTKISRQPGHFHCGCNEKVALASFVMWKTWKARSWIQGELVVEGLHKRWAFHPHEILFILQFLKSKFGYTVEDMFTGSSDSEAEARKEAHVMRKVANYCTRRHFELIGQQMTLDEDFPVLEEEEGRPEWI